MPGLVLVEDTIGRCAACGKRAYAGVASIRTRTAFFGNTTLVVNTTLVINTMLGLSTMLGLCTALALLSASANSLAASTLVDTGRTQCCSSLDPEMPPATYYGATMQRLDDPLLLLEGLTGAKADAADAMPTAAIKELEQRLDDRESGSGAMSPELIEPLADLASAYLASNRTRQAIDTLRRGIHLARINEGLHTPTQVNMVRQLISAHLAQRDFESADEQQAYLYRVLTHKGDHSRPGVRDATLQYANWMRGAYIGDLGRERFPRLVRLNDLYENAIEEIEETQGPNSRELLPYLQGRAQLSYLISVYPGEEQASFGGGAGPVVEVASEDRVRFWRMEEFNFRYGLRALERQRDIIEADENSTPKERAQAHLAIADWHQWHRRYALAIKFYEQAWEMADGSEDATSWLEASFSDPLELPRHTVFAPGAVPLGTLNNAEIAIRFDVSRHGEAKKIRILSETTRDTQPAVTRAYHYLRNMRFRPRVAAGSVVRAEDVERNYYIRY